MAEETPFHPTSKKGEVRAKIATDLVNEWKSGALTGMIARAADFYGPGAKNGMANVLVFEPMSKGQTPMCLASDMQPHSYTYVPDAARALVLLMENQSAWNQTWHMPTTGGPPTGRGVYRDGCEGDGASAEVSRAGAGEWCECSGGSSRWSARCAR